MGVDGIQTSKRLERNIGKDGIMLTRLGYLDFINCLPVYYGILEGKVDINAQIIKGFPNQLNSLLAAGDLDISPISSIEYARHQDEYLLLPDICLNSE